jgi:hypothetical protein
VEIENLRKLVEKMQEETAEVERERGTSSQMESCVRERLLIMERVESLSQLYLGGLEEVRNDVFNIKFTCRDRLDELESQWSEYKRQQETSSEDGPSSSVSRQVSSLARSSLDLHFLLHGFAQLHMQSRCQRRLKHNQGSPTIGLHVVITAPNGKPLT